MTFTKLRRRAAMALWAEILCRAASPATAVLLIYVILALFGLSNGWLLLGSGVLAAGLLIWRAMKIRAPGAETIDRRIEAAAGLKHRPLAALADRPATGGALGEEIFALHQARMRVLLEQARAGWPAPFAATADPFSVRAGFWLLLIIGLAAAGPTAPARLSAAFVLPAWPFAGPDINAWITPPGFAGQAPLLWTGSAPATVLAGGTLSVVLNGSGVLIRYGRQILPAQALGESGRRADLTLRDSGVLRIGPWWHQLVNWPITVVPPSSPVLSLAPISTREETIGLSWQASDAYGLSAVDVTIRPLGYPDALPETATLPGTLGQNSVQLDVRDSPYGGIAAAAALQATNIAGRSSQSAPQPVTLPVDPLHDPTALLLGIIRQNLALTPGQAPAIAAQLFHTAQGPPSAISFAADVELAALASSLRLHLTSLVQADHELLLLIRRIEAGPDFAAAQALELADQALLAALAHGPPDAARLAQLLAAMQTALAQHLANMPANPAGIGGQNFDASSLNRLAAQIAADEAAGNLQKAQAEWQQLAAALQSLQAARPMSAAQAAQARSAGQAAQALAQLIQNQARLLDQTAQGTAKPAQQSALQAGLGALGKTLAQAGLDPLPGLSPAREDMGGAQTALAQQNFNAALAAEGDAIQHLQQAAAALQRQSQQDLSIGQGGSAMPGGMPDGDSPYGGAGDVSIPGLNLTPANPADAIEQEIIRRDANPSLPASTHDYLRRLLQPAP